MIQPMGYFKLHRELYSKPIWKQSTPEQKVVLMTLLAMAWFKPNEWEWKGEKFNTKPGQFVTSLQSIADDCGKGITIQNIRSSLKRFEKLEFLTDESTKQGRLITIANWELYQSQEDNPTKESTKTQQRPNKDPTPKEERKKEIINKYTDDFEKLYDVYPNKKNKSDTFKNYKKCLKIYTHDQLLSCVLNYKRELELKNQTEYIYSSNNFFGNKSYFEDYLNKQTKQKEGYKILDLSGVDIDYGNENTTT